MKRITDHMTIVCLCEQHVRLELNAGRTLWTICSHNCPKDADGAEFTIGQVNAFLQHKTPLPIAFEVECRQRAKENTLTGRITSERIVEYTKAAQETLRMYGGDSSLHMRIRIDDWMKIANEVSEYRAEKETFELRLELAQRDTVDPEQVKKLMEEPPQGVPVYANQVQGFNPKHVHHVATRVVGGCMEITSLTNDGREITTSTPLPEPIGFIPPQGPFVPGKGEHKFTLEILGKSQCSIRDSAGQRCALPEGHAPDHENWVSPDTFHRFTTEVRNPHLYRCESCAPEFGCWNGDTRCSKLVLETSTRFERALANCPRPIRWNNLDGIIHIAGGCCQGRCPRCKRSTWHSQGAHGGMIYSCENCNVEEWQSGTMPPHDEIGMVT